MDGKIQSIFVMVMSAFIAIFLILASAYEFYQGETAMAVLILFATALAGTISWYTRKPYHPRIHFRQ